MNVRTAPLQTVLAVKRRLEQTTPGAVLDEKSVKLAPIPFTNWDATIFCFLHGDKHKFVAELAAPDLPHIFSGRAFDPNKRRRLGLLMAAALFSLTKTILTDRRFRRPLIILQNGSK